MSLRYIPGILMLSLSCLLAVGCSIRQNNDSRSSRPDLPVRLSSTKPGVGISIVTYESNISPAQSHLVLSVNGIRKDLSDLDGLSGHVMIASSEQALEYLRFRTCLDYFLWPMPMEVEIIRKRDLVTLPEYSIPAIISQKKRLSQNDKWTNGWIGLVDDHTFSALGLHPPIVVQSNSGYQVTRAILIESGPGRPRPYKIVEQVTKSGSYSLIDMKLIASHEAKLIEWILPKLK